MTLAGGYYVLSWGDDSGLYYSLNGDEDTWTRVGEWPDASPTAGQYPKMLFFRGTLYCIDKTTDFDNVGDRIVKTTDGLNWTNSWTYGAKTVAWEVKDIKVWKGYLYAAIAPMDTEGAGPGTVIRSADGTSWSTVCSTVLFSAAYRLFSDSTTIGVVFIKDNDDLPGLPEGYTRNKNNSVYTSTNGATWTYQGADFPPDWSGAGVIGGVYCLRNYDIPLSISKKDTICKVNAWTGGGAWWTEWYAGAGVDFTVEVDVPWGSGKADQRDCGRSLNASGYLYFYGFFTSNYPGQLYRSANGTTWTNVFTTPNKGVGELLPGNNSTTFLAATKSGVYRTTDDWANVDVVFANTTSPIIECMAFLSGTRYRWLLI